MLKTDLFPRSGRPFLCWLLPMFVLFVLPGLHAQCPSGQQQCSPININFGVMIDESFVNSFPGPSPAEKEQQARQYATSALNFAMTKLTGTFGAVGYTINFGIAHFPLFIIPDASMPPVPATEDGLVGLQGYVIGYWSQQAKSCIKKDAVIVFTAKPYGFYGVVPKIGLGYGDICGLAPNYAGPEPGNHYALIRKTGPPESTGTTLGHEIGHLMRLPHTDVSGSSCTQMCDDDCLLMCSNTCIGPNDPWTLTSCDIAKSRNLLCDHTDFDCECLAVTGYYPPAYQCPLPSHVYLEVDNFHPLKGCGDRDLITVKVTVCNSDIPQSHKVRLLLRSDNFEMVPNSGDFNKIMTEADLPAYLQDDEQEWRIVDLNASGQPEISHAYAANECKSFTVQMRYRKLPQIGGEAAPLVAYIDVYGGTSEDLFLLPVAHAAGTASGASLIYDMLIPYGTPIYVTGKVKVDGPNNYAFNNTKEIIFGPGGSELSIENPLTKLPMMKLSGCTTMWKGVTVKNGSTLESTESEIRDAQYGIRLNRGAKATVTGTQFFDNNVGIYVEPVTGSGGSGAVTLTANGNTYSCTPGQLKPVYPGQSPAPMQTGYAGIWANDIAGLAIQKDQDGYGNLFENTVMGIVASKASFSVKDAVFKNLVTDPFMPGDYAGAATGTGIYMEYSSATVTGAGSATGSPHSFENCENGIESYLSSLTFKNHHMDQMGAGVRFLMGPANTLNISNNRMFARYRGIDCFQPGVLNNSTVLYNNTIHIKDDNNLGIGIFVGANNVLQKTPVLIDANKITVEHGFAGIRVVSVKGAQVYRNNVSTHHGEAAYGITVEGSNQVLGNCNFITGEPSGIETKQVNLHISHTPASTWACNKTNGGDIGINFTGDCSGSSLKGNKMSSQGNGLLYGMASGVGNVLVGPQQHRGNLFDNASLLLGAKYVGVAANVAQNAYTVDAAEDSDFLPATIFAPIGWFNDAPDNVPTAKCNFIDCPPIAREPDKFLEMERVASGNISALHFEATLKSEAQKQLYASLLENGLPKESGSILSAFFNTAGNPQYKAFGRVEYNLNGAFNIPLADENSLAAYETNMAAQLESLANVEWEMMTPGITGIKLQELEAQRALILLNTSNTFVFWKALQANLTANRLNALADVAAENAALSGNSVWENNRKAATDVFLNTVGLGILTLNEVQKTTLESIAAQCPLEGGSAVYWSRALLELTTGAAQHYEDESNCQTSSLRESVSDDVETSGRLKVVPNPGNGIFRLEYQLETLNPGAMFILFDLRGQEVARHELPATRGEITLNLKNLPDGTYFYYVPGAGRRIANGKLMIIGN